jgi:hypothetical protein
LRCNEQAERGKYHTHTRHDAKSWILANLELKLRLKELIIFERERVSDLHAVYSSSEYFSGASHV